MYLDVFEQDTSEYMQDTYGIRAGYMYPQWQSRYNPDTFWILARYMRDTCTIHARYMGYVS